MLPPHGPASETAYTFHGPVGFAGSDVIHCTLLPPEKTASGLPPLFTSANVIDSETSNVFQSPGLKAVEARGGNIDTNVEASPAPRPRPPPGAPPARPALCGGGGA